MWCVIRLESATELSLTVKLLHRDVGELVGVAPVRQRAAQVVPLVQQACCHMVERHLLSETETEEEDKGEAIRVKS